MYGVLFFHQQTKQGLIVRQKIDWFKLSDLPTWKRNKTPGSKFYLITPFVA